MNKCSYLKLGDVQIICFVGFSHGTDWLDFNQTLASWQVDGLRWWHCFLHPFVVHWHVMNYQSLGQNLCVFQVGCCFLGTAPTLEPEILEVRKYQSFLYWTSIDFLGSVFWQFFCPRLLHMYHINRLLRSHRNPLGRSRLVWAVPQEGSWAALKFRTVAFGHDDPTNLKHVHPGRFFRLVHLQPSPMKRKKNHLKTIHLQGIMFQPLIFSCCTLPYS